MIDLSTSDRQTLSAILKEFLANGEKVWAFGSRVKGTARPWSDIDLVIEGENAMPTADYYRLQDALEESELSIRVDVLDWYRLSDEFRAQIDQSKVPFDY
ncbi:hypothetical protein GCM10011348_21020 [Marinobacterium nitratireducens]|uniref:Polymerase nucleotidyl transferase domain-containing protein n=1 Tax=Marinobacterium nitratireducens TaxID=518897 RepID=A0A917ZDU6_9GAMM|nr:nucleotidyltransferase domain-containing protein [Marinobacterium nitratireducens]GGO81618.1 hypothetical protein GCM10011348_21020 [Marinobacterium nitratireducens]